MTVPPPGGPRTSAGRGRECGPRQDHPHGRAHQCTGAQASARSARPPL